MTQDYHYHNDTQNDNTQHGDTQYNNNLWVNFANIFGAKADPYCADNI